MKPNQVHPFMSGNIQVKTTNNIKTGRIVSLTLITTIFSWNIFNIDLQQTSTFDLDPFLLPKNMIIFFLQHISSIDNSLKLLLAFYHLHISLSLYINSQFVAIKFFSLKEKISWQKMYKVNKYLMSFICSDE